MRFSKTISIYLMRAVTPYFAMSWLLLTVVLFVQQAGRFTDIFFSPTLPGSFVWQLTTALIPSVIAFTCPMAALVGIIIGLSRMQSDNELVAIRSIGIGNFSVTLPLAAIGLALSIFALFVNLFGVPYAARIVRQVALQTAIFKLESPIEPGVFNTEVAGYTIYVRDGDITDGQWKNVFVYNEDAGSGETRLITSRQGRIDSSGQSSELVLENAVVSTFTLNGSQDKFASESIGEVRFAIKTRRSDLIDKLSVTEMAPEELGLAELGEYARQRTGKERTEAQILSQRRIVLSIAPFLFSLLAAAMLLRFYRRGRGFGIFLALITLIVYFFLTFAGEQLARTGTISVTLGGLIPPAAVILATIVFNLGGRIGLLRNLAGVRSGTISSFGLTGWLPERRNLLVDLTTGLRDFDIVMNILKYYFLALGFFSSVFITFTAFELWRYAGSMDGGLFMLAKYLFFLLPWIYIQISPTAAMIATLATYVIKSRQNEIVMWASAGQSVYRLLFPCILLMLFLGIVNWQIQERITPVTNPIQDSLRLQIRNRGRVRDDAGKYWVANDKRIYSFKMENNASDNEFRILPPCFARCSVQNLAIYEFVNSGAKLQSVYRVSEADWDHDRFIFKSKGRKFVLGDEGLSSSDLAGQELVVDQNPFMGIRKKPSHLNASDTRIQMEMTESDVEKRNFAVALEKKYTTIFLPFVIGLFTAPFALSLNRKGRVVTVGYAVGLWLIFITVTAAFEQLGLNGTLPAGIAVWAPLVLFTMFGIYLLSKVRT